MILISLIRYAMLKNSKPISFFENTIYQFDSHKNDFE